MRSRRGKERVRRGAAAVLVATAVTSTALAAPGDLDPGFATGGKQTRTFAYGANAVAVQADGRIVVAGRANRPATGADFVVARFTPAGKLDQSFGGGDGRTLTRFMNGPNTDTAKAVALQDDGKIVVVGDSDQDLSTAINDLDLDFAIARFTRAGHLDQSFGGGDGRLITRFANGPGNHDRAEAVAIQANGRIVAVGSSDQDPGTGPGESDLDFALARLTRTGHLDQSFGGGDGRRTSGFGAGDSDDARDVAIQADGRIVVGGEATRATTDRDFGLARFMPNGVLDPSFGGDGKVATDFDQGGQIDGVGGLSLRDGKIIAAGFSDDPVDEDFAAARYRSNGTLDPTFSGDGRRRVEFAGSCGEGEDMAVQQGGRIVVAGTACPGATDRDFALVRLTSAGSLDQSFGGDGKVTTDFAGQTDDGFDVAISPNGRIVMAGTAYVSGGNKLALARYLGG